MKDIIGVFHRMNGDTVWNIDSFLLQCAYRVGDELLLESLIRPALGDDLLVLLSLIVHLIPHRI